MSMSCELGFGFFDGAGGHHLVALLPQDGRAQDQVLFTIVEQQDADGLDEHGCGPNTGVDFGLEVSSLI